MDASLGQVLTNQFGEKYLYSVNGAAFNATGSQVVFEQRFGESLFKEETLYIILGSDSGLLLDYVRSKSLPRGTRYLFIELPEILALLALESGGETDVRCCDLSEWNAIANELDIALYQYLDRISIVKSFAATDARVPAYRSLYNQFENELLTWQDVVYQELGSRPFIMTQLMNVADNEVPAIVLRGALAGKTGVLLAGGPSLDDYVPWVKAYRESLVVISVSRVTRRLLDVGILPDIVVSVDPFQVSFDVSKEMLDLPKSVLLVNSYHIVPSLLAQWRGPSVYLGNRLPWVSELNSENIPGAGPTVSNSAVVVAAHLGLKQLVLIGMDLCFSRVGHTHATCSSEHTAGPRLDDTGVWVKTNGGWDAPTIPGLFTAIKSLESQAQAARGVGLRLINPSPASAVAEHVDHVGLEEVSLEPILEPVSMVLARIVQPMNSDGRLGYLRALDAELKSVRQKLAAMDALCEEALGCNAKIHDGQSGYKHKQRIEKIERKLDRTYKKYANLIKRFGMPRFIKLSRPLAMEEWTDDELRQYGDGYYSAYRGALKEFIGYIDDAITRVKSRIAEIAQPPSIIDLSEQWTRDGQFGRAQVWRERFPDRYSKLVSEDQAVFVELERQRVEERQRAEARDASRSADERMDWLRALPERINKLYDEKNQEVLAQTLVQLETYESDYAKKLCIYAAALLAALECRFEHALDKFQTLVDQETFVEPVLRRVLEITIANNDFDSALMVGHSLAVLSSAHLPHYAQMLKIMGRHDEAIDAYTTYLTEVPDDHGAMLKLGRLYLDVGAEEAASVAFGYVIDRDPQNTAAVTLLSSLKLVAQTAHEPTRA